MRHLLLICRNADSAILVERNHSFAEKSNRLSEVIDDNGHKYIEFKIALRGSHTDCGIVTDNLNGNHGNSLALSRIYLTRHNGRARLILRNLNLAETETWTRSKPTNVICYFHKVSSKSLECTVCKNNLVL